MRLHFVSWAILLLTAVLVILPLWICVVNSFKTDAEISRGYLSLSSAPSLINFEKIVVQNGYFRYLGNSIRITFLCMALSFAMVPFMCFMIVDHWKRRGYRILYVALCASMFIPRNLILFPLIKRFYAWNLMNQTGVVLYYSFSLIPESIFLLTPLFRTFNQSQKEAAMLDGCSYFQYYLRVFLPVCLPFCLAIMSLNCISIWNSFFMPLMILNKDPKSWTIPIFIYNYLGENDSQLGLAFATCFLSLLPIALVYSKFHKGIIDSMSSH